MAAMKTELTEGETVVHEGRANLQRGAESVGGRAYLTEERLIFEPHALNLQRGAEVLATADITQVETGFTKLLGVVPLAPNAVIVTAGERHVRLTVTGRKAWAEHLRRGAGLS